VGRRDSWVERTIELRDVEGLREEVLDVLRQHGIDPDSAQSVDTAGVPGLEEAILRAFQNHGVDSAAITGADEAGSPEGIDKPGPAA
jgi:hypothetical protein